MRLRRLSWFLPILLLTALPAKADSNSDYVWVNGSYTGISNGFAIGPYGGSITTSGGVTTPTQFFCVDFNDSIQGDTGWTANVTSLSSSDFSKTLKDNQTFYLEAAWLITQMMHSPNNKALDAQLQWAIWFLSLTPAQQKGSFFDKASDILWDEKALSAVKGGFSAGGWEILTPTGGYGQEFMVPGPGAATPEPSTVVLLLAGMVVLIFLSQKK